MAYIPTGNPVGRPPIGYSKRKWSESVKALKALIANPKTMVEQKLRGVELLAMIYGIEPPVRQIDKLAIKELVRRRNFDRAVAEGVDRTLEQQNEELALARMNQAERDDAERMARVFDKALEGNYD